MPATSRISARPGSLLRPIARNSALQVLGRHLPGPGEADLRGFAWHYLARRADTSRRTLRGFDGAVFSVQFSPGGDRLAAAGKDGFVRIWETGSWALLRAFPAPMRRRPTPPRSPPTADGWRPSATRGA